MVETRFNVVRSGVPRQLKTVRKLRDYLPAVDTAADDDVSFHEAAVTVRGWSPGSRASGT